MQELTIGTLIAVLEEMFGPVLFWALFALVTVVTAAYIYVLIRDRALSIKKFLWAQLSMPIGAVVAVWLVMSSTDSGFVDLGGPVDFVVLLGVAVLGAVGCAILVYTLQSLLWPTHIQKKAKPTAQVSTARTN
ncbi:MAG TPA: DUF5368 domain-containing protein [Paenalcaligenes sp.]|nr:DUF5368 domain-containing protein [Paenalcaligenes sp.]